MLIISQVVVDVDVVNAWEQGKLNKYVTKQKSYSTIRSEETENITGYRYVHYGDIHTMDNKIIEDEEVLPYINKKENYTEFMQNGDIILADASEDYIGIAEPLLLLTNPSDKIISGLHTIFLRPNKNIDSLFLYYVFNTVRFKKHGYKMGTGSKIFGITAKSVLDYLVICPDKAEQQLIANVLKKIDDLLTLYKRKLELLEELKRGYLQQMFPRKDERMPKIRFEHYDGQWESLLLKDFLKERKDYGYESDYELVTFSVEKGVTSKSDRYDRSFLVRETNKKYKITHTDDIVYNPANLKFGAISRNKYGTAIFSPIYITLVSEVNPYFTELLVTRNDFINYALTYQEGTVYERMAVNVKDFLSLTAKIPGNDEQIMITKTFEKINKLVESYTMKLNHLDSIKSYLLNKMFI